MDRWKVVQRGRKCGATVDGSTLSPFVSENCTFLILKLNTIKITRC